MAELFETREVLEVMNAQQDAVAQEKHRLERNFKTVAEEADSLTQQLSVLRAEHAKQAAHLHDVEESLASANKQLGLVEAKELLVIMKIDSQTRQIRDLHQERDQLKEALEAAEAGAQEARIRVDEAIKSLHDEEKKAKELEQRLTVTSQHLAAADNKVKDLDGRLIETNGLLNTANDKLTALENEIVELEDAKEAIEWELLEKTTDAAMYEKQEQEALQMYEAEMAAKKTAESECSRLKIVMEAADDKVATLTDEISELRKNASEATATLRLEQQKVENLEGRLAETSQLLTTANNKAAVLENEISELEDANEATEWKLLEKTTDAAMYEKQEQEALQMYEAEKSAKESAEKSHDDMATKYTALLAQMEAMKKTQQELEDRNATLTDRNRALETQLHQECNAHAATREDFDKMQTRLAVSNAENKFLKDELDDKENVESPRALAKRPLAPAKRRRNLFSYQTPQKAPLQSNNSGTISPVVESPLIHSPSTGFNRIDPPLSDLVHSPSVPLAVAPTSLDIRTHRRTSSSVQVFQRMVRLFSLTDKIILNRVSATVHSCWC
jgi:chromosome segregation ATPase